MPGTLNEQVVDQITTTNAKGLADMAQTAMGLSTQNAVANQQQVQAIQNASLQGYLTIHQTLTALAAKRLLDTSAEEAVAFTKQIGSDLQDKINNIGAALAGVQEDVKIAQTTPPQTGTGGAFGSDAGTALLQQLANIQAVLQGLEAKIRTP